MFLCELVGCCGFNGPLRQAFGLYRAVCQRGRKKREKIDERNKSTACGCQHSAADAFKNTLGIFDYKQLYLITFKWHYYCYVGGFRMTHFKKQQNHFLLKVSSRPSI